MCKQVLATNGCFVVKVFQGEGFDDYLRKFDHYLTQLKYVNLRHHVDDPVRYISSLWVICDRNNWSVVLLINNSQLI